MIRIGHVIRPEHLLPKVESADRDVQRHFGKPWLNHSVAHHYGIGLHPDPVALGSAAGFSEAAVSRHTLISGTTGVGKSRIYLSMASQLLRQGCSMVAVDPKEDTLLHLVELARQAGVLAQNITTFLPRQKDGIPGWNPLAGADPGEAAEEFADTLWAANERGPQMGEALSNALIFITAHGLALPELARLLRSSEYREHILSLPDPPEWEDELDIAREYFRHDYSDKFAAAVTNKFSAVVRNRYLRRVVSATGNTVSFDRLWRKDSKKPRDEQRLIVVHLDNENLSEEAMRFLGGSIAWRTYRAADRVGGPNRRPVVLGLDEIGLAEGYLAGALGKILAIARSKNLRLITSTQFVEQLPPRVQKDLLKLTHARAYLRIEWDDAEVIARTLVAGKSSSVPDRVLAEPTPPAKNAIDPLLETARYTIHDAERAPLAVGNPLTWDAFRPMLGPSASRAERKASVELLARAGGLCADRVYVHDAVTGNWTELFTLVSGLRDDEWFIDGPRPVSLVVRFPKVTLRALPGGEGDAVSRWAYALTGLKDREAVIQDKTAGRPSIIRTDTVPDAMPPQDYIDAALSNGVAEKEADAAYRKRREEMNAWSAPLKITHKITQKSSAGTKADRPAAKKPGVDAKEPKPNERGLL